MKTVWGVITAIVQFIVGYFVMFTLLYFGLSALLEGLGLVGPGNVNPAWNTPVQFLTMALGASLGVWGVGWLDAKLRKTEFNGKKSWWGTLAGSVLGVILVSIWLVIQGTVGLLPFVFALVGALAGYYLYPNVWK
jgi:hypothetical protein